MSVVSSVGTVMAVDNQAPATYDQAGFEALTFVDVGELSDLPAFGSEASLATHTPLKTGIVAKRRGSLNFGSVTLTLALDPDDAGAAVLETLADAAAGSDATVSVKISLVGGAVQYYTAQVMSFKTNISNADAITMAECTLEIDNSIVKVAAP